MTLESELLERLNGLAKRRKIVAIAEKSGIEQSNLARAKDGKQNLGLDAVSRLLDAMGARVVFPEQDYDEIKHDMKKVGLTVLPVHAAAGAGKAFDYAEFEPKFHIAVPNLYIRGKTCALYIEGNSMEPTILDKAVVGVSRGSITIIQGKIYAVYLEYEGLVVKRVYIDHANKHFILRSDNKYGDYPDITVPFEGGCNFIFGQVIWVLQLYEKAIL
jgi:phage repressor protein C with HTH and peptisase S24 domain